MHVRRGHYIGVAPVPGGLANACLVVPHGSARRNFDDPAAALTAAIAADATLAPRFAARAWSASRVVLGPMAVDVSRRRAGLLLAGDAAGFIDPMTGDGLRLALPAPCWRPRPRSTVLHGRCLEPPPSTCSLRRRHAAFAAKWRFNRALRHLVASPAAVTRLGASPRASCRRCSSAVIRYAGDCSLQGSEQESGIRNQESSESRANPQSLIPNP